MMEAIETKKICFHLSFLFLRSQNQVTFITIMFSLLPFPHKSKWVKSWLAMMLFVMGL